MAEPPRVAVATSGGLDSTALLHCTVRAAALLGIRVHALHVVHGLQPDAMAWRLQLEARVRRWARSGWPVDFHWRAAIFLTPTRSFVAPIRARCSPKRCAVCASAAGCW